MHTILPGRPQARYQAVTTGCWNDRQFIAYISGNAIVILDGPQSLLQTTYQESSEEFVAIAFDEISGKIAAASARTIYVYKPYGQDEGAIRWSLQYSLFVEDNDNIETLSWGFDEELLVGSASLTLFSTYHASGISWTKRLASPAKFADFSYDTSLIASCGQHDQFVKLWRRLSLADQRFEYAYLPHPALVTGMHWRKPYHREQSMENVLYTLCLDNKLRIWVPGDPLNNDILRLWDEIDLLQAIQPRTLLPRERSRKRYAFIINSKDFMLATESAVEQGACDEGGRNALEHLIDVANRNPEVCVTLDDRGNMSAWGLGRVNCKARETGDVFNVAHTDGLDLGLNQTPPTSENNVQFSTLHRTSGSNNFTILVNHFDGRLEWYEGRLDQLFDLAPRSDRLRRIASWTGHANPINQLVRTQLGKALISRTHDGCSVVWRRRSSEFGSLIERKSRIMCDAVVHHVSLLANGAFAVFLHDNSISLWDCRDSPASLVASHPCVLPGRTLCLICLPELDIASCRVHLAAINSEMHGVSWAINLPESDRAIPGNAVEGFAAFRLGLSTDLACIRPVDPAGTAPVISGFLDTFARDVAISWTTSGVLKSWTAKLDLERCQIEWLNTATVETLVENPSLGSATSIRKAALVSSSGTTLTIWNTTSGQLECEHTYENSVLDLDWSSTPSNQSILAVGFASRISIYTQLRFDYLDARPAWAVVQNIDVRGLTPHPIGDSVWLSNGNLAIGAGNQLFICEDLVDPASISIPDLRQFVHELPDKRIFSVVRSLNGPLPVYHPQFITQTILAGKLITAQQILLRLLQRMRFWTEGDDFDSQLDFSSDDFSDTPGYIPAKAWREMTMSLSELTDIEQKTVTEDVALALNEVLTNRKIPMLSKRAQLLLIDVVDCITVAEKHRQSIDDNGARFLLFFRQHILRSTRETPETVSWREITWAFHSQSQEILTDLVARQYHGKMKWIDARESGIFMWMSDLTTLKTQFEIIARNEYTKSEDRNPVECSLYYLALRKKAVLVGLWRMAGSNKEQAATHRLLSNNFDEPRWRTAALKNAYALMGRRRFEYAAAFFLLADRLGDAVNVLANQHGDLQLAIAVARVYGGDDHPVLTEFLSDKVLPQASSVNNRWLATWAYWMLGKRDKAVRALVMPLTSVLSPPTTPKLQSKLYLTDDPALIVLYQQLRAKSLQTLKGALSISPRAEWEFIMHTARLYQRMGCDLLALHLVRSWEFLLPMHTVHKSATSVTTDIAQTAQPQQSVSPVTQDCNFDPRRLLRRRSSLVVNDLPADIIRRPSTMSVARPIHNHDEVASQSSAIYEDSESDVGPIVKPHTFYNGIQTKDSVQPSREKQAPTQFFEPDAASLLDAFGL